MAGFFDDPMFTSSSDTPTVTRYPGTDFGLFPRWAYNTAWPPASAGTLSASPAAAPPPRPASPPPPTPRAGSPLLLPPPAPSGVAANNNIGPAFNNRLTNHAATLMALGAGIAQGGIGKGLAMASTAAENERNRQAQQMSFMQTYKALTDGGVPQEEALAAVLNPGLMRSLAAKYLGPRGQANAAGKAAASVPAAVTLPRGVPEGAVYSPASWKAPDGTLFNDDGEPLTK